MGGKSTCLATTDAGAKETAQVAEVDQHQNAVASTCICQACAVVTNVNDDAAVNSNIDGL